MRKSRIHDYNYFEGGIKREKGGFRELPGGDWGKARNIQIVLCFLHRWNRRIRSGVFTLRRLPRRTRESEEFLVLRPSFRKPFFHLSRAGSTHGTWKWLGEDLERSRGSLIRYGNKHNGNLSEISLKSRTKRMETVVKAKRGQGRPPRERVGRVHILCREGVLSTVSERVGRQGSWRGFVRGKVIEMEGFAASK